MIRAVSVLSITASLGLKLIAWVSALFIMIAVPADVLSRNMTGNSFSGVVEMAQFALVALAAAGMALAQRERLHIDTDLVMSRLRSTTALRLTRASRVISFCTVALISATSCVAAFDSYIRAERSLGTFRMPVWPSRAVLAFGFVALAVYLAHEALRQDSEDVVSRDGPDVHAPVSAV